MRVVAVSIALCVLGAAAKDFCCYWPRASDLSSCDECTEEHYDTDSRADCESDKDNTWCPSSAPGPSPAPPSPSAVGLSLLAVGDWGGSSDNHPTTSGQISAAAGMSQIADQINAQGILLLGDNFYDHGVHTCKSKRFQETFEDVYTIKEFNNLPFHVVAGNHDYGDGSSGWNVTAQIDYKDAQGRWLFPSLWYSLPFSLTTSSGTSRTLQLVMIDTVNLAGLDSSVRRASGPADVAGAEKQWAWIEQELKSSTADFLWVAGHYPIYSAGDDGTVEVLVKRLLPLLRQYGAHYIHGHDHMLQHISYEGVEMYLTGMGKECCYGAGSLDTVPKGAIKYLIEGDGGQGSKNVGPKPSSPVNAGFASVTFDDTVSIKYYNQDGDVLYTAPEVSPRSGFVTV